MHGQYKSYSHQIHRDTDLPHLHELSKKYILYFFGCVTLKMSGRFYDTNKKDSPVLLTACLMLSPVHNGFLHSKPLIY